MPTVQCRTCGAENHVDFAWHVEWPWCDQECYEAFVEAVQRLVDGYYLEELGIGLDARLAQEAAKEVRAYHRSEVIYARDVEEAQYLRNRPGRRDWVKRRYFPV